MGKSVAGRACMSCTRAVVMASGIIRWHGIGRHGPFINQCELLNGGRKGADELPNVFKVQLHSRRRLNTYVISLFFLRSFVNEAKGKKAYKSLPIKKSTMARSSWSNDENWTSVGCWFKIAAPLKSGTRRVVVVVSSNGFVLGVAMTQWLLQQDTAVSFF